MCSWDSDIAVDTMMKTPGALLLLAVFLGSYEAKKTARVAYPTGAPHPGTCPLMKLTCKMPPPPVQCQNDSKCLNTQKCCDLCGWKTCLTAVKDEPHPGTCPPMNLMCKLPLPLPKCESDSECLKTQKCCNRCGKQCLPAVGVSVHDGSCPAPPHFAIPIPCIDIQDTCQDDSSCAVDQKCCKQPCGKACVKSRTVHAGSCPQPPPFFPCEPSEKDRCQDDSSCAEDEKCCPSMRDICSKACEKSIP